MKCIEGAEAKFFDLLGTIRFGALRNDDFNRK
jgi:hypothetical protein